MKNIYDGKPWTAEDVQQLLNLVEILNVDSLDRVIDLDGEHGHARTVADTVLDTSNNPQDLIEEKEKTQVLLKYIEQLKPSMQSVLKYRYGLYDGAYHTLDETGKRYNVTRERIRQVEQKAITKLKEMLTRDGYTIENL